MTWNGGKPGWDQRPIRRDECDFHHLVAGLYGHHAPTGPWGIVMACIARYAKMQRVVELGVCYGGTTVFLADAMRDTGGTCIAVDQAPCLEARERLMHLGLEAPHCYFKEGKTSEVPYDGIPIDLLFIDAGHSVEDQRSDWNRWSLWVRSGGWVFVDNVTSEAGTMAWLATLLETERFKRDWQYILCPAFYGMAMMRRREHPSDAEVIRARMRGEVL